MHERVTAEIVKESAKIIKRGSMATLLLQPTSIVETIPCESPFAKVKDFQIDIKYHNAKIIKCGS